MTSGRSAKAWRKAVIERGVVGRRLVVVDRRRVDEARQRETGCGERGRSRADGRRLGPPTAEAMDKAAELAVGALADHTADEVAITEPRHPAGDPDRVRSSDEREEPGLVSVNPFDGRVTEVGLEPSEPPLGRPLDPQADRGIRRDRIRLVSDDSQAVAGLRRPRNGGIGRAAPDDMGDIDRHRQVGSPRRQVTPGVADRDREHDGGGGHATPAERRRDELGRRDDLRRPSSPPLPSSAGCSDSGRRRGPRDSPRGAERTWAAAGVR